jgi:hypothetical protein
MHRRLLVTSVAALAGLALAPVAAQGAIGRFIPADRVDSPVTALGDVDIARDGTGGLVYVKPDGGVDHVFISRLAGGAWQPPERLDGNLPTPSSQPVVSAADGGRLVIAYISGGALFAVTRPALDQPYTAPQLVAAAASNPAIDLSINNVAYLSFTIPGGGGGDVVVARKDRTSSAFAGIPGALDVVQASPAGLGGGRSKVAVAADGVALVVWGEASRVVARRVFETRISTAPQDATVPALGGFGGGAADVPDVDVQDDSSFAWVVFRQAFGDGRTHAVARKLVGSQFDPPATIDGQPFPSPDDVGPPRIDINGRGEGYAASALGGVSFGAVLKDRKLNPGVLLGPTFPAQGLPVAATDDSGDGIVAWMGADTAVHARAFDNRRDSRVVQAPQGDTPLSNLAGGPVAAPWGLEAAADRAGDVAVAFVQGVPGSRAIMVASFDRSPGAFRLSSRTSWRNAVRVPLKWAQAFELWGPVTYAVELNGQTMGQTTAPTLALPPTLPDGLYRWSVTAIDRRGQVTGTARRLLRHDATMPRATLRVSGARRRGRPVRVRVTATDANPARRPASGIGSVRIAFGDGARASSRAATHRYRRSGRFTVRVTVSDRAGNVAVASRRITIR